MTRRSRRPAKADVAIEPPQSAINIGTERALLGCLLLDPAQWANVDKKVPRELIELAIGDLADPGASGGGGLFADSKHGVIFGAMARMARAGRSLGLETVSGELAGTRRIEAAGGLAYVALLTDDIFSPFMAGQHLDALLRAWRARAASIAGQRLAAAVANGDDLAEAIKAHHEALALIDAAGSASDSRIQLHSPSEIMDRPEDDIKPIIGDHLIQPGALTLIVGQPGLGKSRIAMQFAVETLAGRRHWLGAIPIHRRDLRILIFQTENSRSRVNRELRCHLRGSSAEEREAVNAGLRLILPDRPEDRFFPLNDQATVERMTRSVSEFAPNIVIFDPYADFFAGESENDAVQTRDTVSAMTRIAQAGDPMAAVIVLHHARSGRVAAGSAVGYDKGAFARGSKALTASARAQVNIAPGDPDDSDLLVISCGKASDGKPFDTFAVKLDSDTFLYDLHPDFDLEAWTEETQSAKPKRGGRPASANPTICLAAIKSAGRSGMRRNELRNAVVDMLNCGTATADRLIRAAAEAGILLKTGELYGAGIED